MSTPNAIEVPGSLLAAIQERLARDDVDAILHSADPLTNWNRRQLELARKSWLDQLQKANGMIKAINARLAAVPDSPAGQAGRREARRTRDPRCRPGVLMRYGQLPLLESEAVWFAVVSVIGRGHA